jgi:hypothetical protein
MKWLDLKTFAEATEGFCFRRCLGRYCWRQRPSAAGEELVCTLLWGYRYLYWDFDDRAVFDNLDINGPYAGVKFLF